MDYNEKTSNMVGRFIKEYIVDDPLFKRYSHLHLNNVIEYHTPLFMKNYATIKSYAMVNDVIITVCEIIIKDNCLIIDIANTERYKNKGDYGHLNIRAQILFHEIITIKYLSPKKWEERS